MVEVVCQPAAAEQVLRHHVGGIEAVAAVL